MSDQPPKTQQTQPKGIDPKTGEPYEPVEISVPRREDFEALIDKAAEGAQDIYGDNWSDQS